MGSHNLPAPIDCNQIPPFDDSRPCAVPINHNGHHVRPCAAHKPSCPCSLHNNERYEFPGGEADVVGGERVGGGRSPPPSYQQDQPSGSPLTSSPSANLARAVMASPGFKCFEAKQNRQIADLRQDINMNLGQITDIKLELKSGFSNVSDGINKGLTSVESMIKSLTNTISNVL